jgi:hypothetical protein
MNYGPGEHRSEIRAVAPARETKPPIGLAKNKLKIPKSFFKPLAGRADRSL